MDQDFNAMALFVKVVENKSFSVTAKRLAMPISTVSRKISELEKSLGVRLLERSTRKLRLTELGEEYYEFCKRGLDEFEAGTHLLQDKQAEVTGTLRLSAPPNLGDVLVAPLICGFQKKFPRVCVKVFNTERNLDLIDERVDVAFRVGELKDSNLIARQLIEYRHLLVASPSYLETNMPEITRPEDLEQHRLITFGGWQEQPIWLLKNNGNTHKLRVNFSISSNDYASIMYALAQHQGIAEIPSIICRAEIKSGRLIEVLPAWKFPNTKLSLIYPSNKNLSRVVRHFVDYCMSKDDLYH